MSAPSKFPAPPQYPPREPRKLSYNEECAATGGRSYASAKMQAARTVEIRRPPYSQSGGRRGYGAQRAE